MTGTVSLFLVQEREVEREREKWGVSLRGVENNGKGEAEQVIGLTTFE